MLLDAVFSVRMLRLLEQREAEIRDGRFITLEDVADRIRAVAEMEQGLDVTSDSKNAAA